MATPSRMKGSFVFRSWKARLGVAALAAVTLGSVGFTSAGASAAKPAAAKPAKSVAIVGSGSDAAYKPTRALDMLYNQSPGGATIVTSGTQPLDYSCLADSADTIKSENYEHDVVSE